MCGEMEPLALSVNTHPEKSLSERTVVVQSLPRPILIRKKRKSRGWFLDSRGAKRESKEPGYRGIILKKGG